MKIFIIILLSALFFFSVSAQPSDLLILKKKGRTIRTFFPSSPISFHTDQRSYDAYIQSIYNDSLFLLQYDVRQVPTNLGVYMLDTVATYHFAVNYKEIEGFGKDRNRKFDWSGSGGALLGGGVLLTTVGLGTWLFTKPNTQYYASPYLVGSAALLAGIGYLLAKSAGKGMEIGKKYSIEYIRVK